jgi:uncharacterized protein (DUF1697 family)
MASSRTVSKKVGARPRARARGQGTYVALIRGINVGGHGSVPMQRLASWFNEAGCADVRTYIQSGNVIFTATPTQLKSLAKQIGSHIAKWLGRAEDVSVVVRSARELDEIIAHNPYPAAASNGKTLHCAFLEQIPAATDGSPFAPQQASGASFALHGRELYLHTPEGIGHTKLNNAFFRDLRTPCTMRNWNTVLKLQAIIGAEFSR